MKYKIKLFSTYEVHDVVTQPPQWWRNFLLANKVHGVEEINQALEPYHARFRTSIKRSPWGIRSVTFDSKEDYVLFVLRWS
jgi:hypothetical protein